MKKILASLIVVCGLAALLMAQKTPDETQAATPDIPDIIVSGYKAYKTGSYTQATTTWAHDSSLGLDPLRLPAIRSYLSVNANNAGLFLGADAISVVKLSPSTEEVYTVARFERQAIYIAFTCYKVNDKWIITLINANVDPAQVLPTAIRSGTQGSV